MPARVARRCAHCGLDAGPAPRRSGRPDARAGADGEGGKVFCCAGCEAVYGILHAEGLGRFYDAGGVGSLSARLARDGSEERRVAFPALDALEAAGQADLDVVGMRCASCAWLIERYLGRRAGVVEVRISYATATCRLRWDRGRTSLAHLLVELERIGYRARPSNPKLQILQTDHDARRLLVRAGISAFLAMNVMIAAVALYAGEFQGIGAGSRGTLRWISALLAAPVVLYGGWPFHRGAWTALLAHRATMDTLIALGAITAYGVSLYGLVTGGPVYFDTAAMIVTLILAGRLLEHAARRSGLRAIRNLLALEPEVARLVTPDGAATVEADTLAAGSVVEVRPGERFPADGVVLEGTSGVDESMLTGESAPRDVSPGSEVVGGSVNGWGLLRVRALRVGSETAVARIVRAVQRAMEARAPLERLADRAMAWFVPGVLVVALLTAAAWTVAGAGLERALLVGVAVVVIACPCALGLATPMALAVALGEAAGRGIFFRSGDALERAASVGRVAFDKTGTLTDGRLAVIATHPESGWTDEQLLEVACSVEAGSEHALARAIIREAEKRGCAQRQAVRFRAHAGGGVEAAVEGRPVLVGSAGFLSDQGVAAPAALGDAAGSTLAYVAVDGRCVGSVEAGDRVRPEAADAVRSLTAMGIASSLLSGDRDEAVRRAADAVGIPPARALGGLKPEEKVEAVTRLRDAGEMVAMVGDGINDAPALAAADVGIALGTGTDVALEAADVALTASDLTAVPTALAVARRARRVVRQNLGWAMGYNLVAIPLAAAGVLHPIVAAAAMALSSLSVLGNSLRLRTAA